MSGCMADQFYQSGRNRQGETVQLRNLDYVMGNHYIAIAADRNGFQYCVFDLALNKETEGACARKDEMTCTEQLTELLGTLLAQTDDVTAIAIGVPGAVSSTGQIFAIPQIPEWEQFELQSYLEEQFNIDIVVENDINAVAIGYLQAEQNAGNSVKDLIYFYVGEKGLRAGVMIGGKLHCGCNSFAGEVGYMQVAQDSIEFQLSGMSDEERGKLLAKVITNMICVLDPQQIVLGGKVTEMMAEQIGKACQEFLPLKRMPVFTCILDSSDYYFGGLGTLGQELSDHRIRLQ